MRVLLVEDFIPLLNSVAQGLREAGFAVDTATDGKTGLWYATSNEYDVMVLDLMLPQLDGLSVLKRLRQAGRRHPVLILTARDTVPDRVAGLDTGADDYLVKPFAFEELLARIKALVRRQYDQPNTVIQVGALQIDTAARRVRLDEQEIQLTAREYGLLEYLAVRFGQIVTRTDIWEHLYEFDSDALSNVVNVYIGYLRKKIDPPDGPSFIRTVRGSGYVLEEPGT